MALTREQLLEKVQKIVRKYTNIQGDMNITEVAENVIDIGLHFANELHGNKTAAGIEQLITSVVEKSNTYEKKAISGMALTFALTSVGLSENIVGSLTGIYIADAFGKEASTEKTAVTHMMREIYIIASTSK